MTRYRRRAALLVGFTLLLASTVNVIAVFPSIVAIMLTHAMPPAPAPTPMQAIAITVEI